MTTPPEKTRMIHVDFPDVGNFLVMPESFPYEIWDDRDEWAEDMAMAVHAVSKDVSGAKGAVVSPRPDAEWIAHTKLVIASAQQHLTSDCHYPMLLFPDRDKMPIPFSLTNWLVEVPWEAMLPLYTGEHDPENVDPPVTEAFEVEGAEIGIRSIRHTILDSEDQSLLVRLVYAWRRAGLDTQIIASFTDPTMMPETVPILDAFARGTVSRLE